MIAGSHRVRRLRWRVSVASRDEAFAVRPRLRHSVTGQILPALARLFDEIPLGTDVVHIPRLDIRVRASGAGTLEDDCLDAIRAQLAERLRAVALGARTARPPAGDTDAIVDRRETRLAALRQYLRSGVLPWYFAGGGGGPATTAALADIAREELQTVAADIPAAPADAIVFVFRLLALLPEAAWPVLARAVASRSKSESGEDLIAAADALSSTHAPALVEHVRLQLVAALIVMAGAADPVMAAGLVRSHINLPATLTFDRVLAHAPAVLSLLDPGRRRPMPDREPAADPDQRKRATPPPVTHPKGLWRDRTAEVAPGTEPVSKAGFGLAVSHAGLVLLAPFIPRLFEARDIARAQTKSLAAAVLPRACALLHYAATGREDGHEFEMAFIKILLGVHHDTPVPFARGLLKAADRKEVESLLDAVIGHWRVLKRTSPDALRTAFLQRAGLLFEEATAWRLQVEGASIDLLLDHLPWGISTVTLPWLNKPIQTEWATH